MNAAPTGTVRSSRGAETASQNGGSTPQSGWGVSGLSVAYGRTEALRDLSVSVPPGRVTAVVGGDGSGKTTLLRALAGLVRPASGEVFSPGRNRIGFVSAQGGIYRDLTVDENLAFSGRGYHMTSQALRERTALLLARTGLAEARHRLGEQLSGGMRQKLAVAMALLHEPPLLIFDEPTTGVDPVSRVQLWRLISGAAAAGTSVLLSTTYIDEAERAAWVCVLDAGRSLLAGTPDQVIATVGGRIYSVPSQGSRPPYECWPDGAAWRMYVPGGEQPPAGADRVPERLDDAVIAAALGLTGRSGGRPPGRVETDAQSARTGATDGAAPGRALASRAGAMPAASTVPAGSAAPAAPVEPDAGTTPGAPLVTATGVSRRFGDFVAVRGVDLDVHPGEIVGLLGANGAGKTTLIRLLLGLVPQSGGQIELFGEPPSRATRALLGYVPQGLGLWEDMTAAENLSFAAGAFGVPAPASLDPDLKAARHTLVSDLPLGQRRRLAFAAALAHQPRLLVLDEPTSGVDPLARARLWDTIHGAAHQGAGVLVTTHYMEEASQCDRLVILATGEVVATGTVASIVGDHTVTEIETQDWAAAFAALDAAGVQVSLRGRRLRIAAAQEQKAAAALAAAGIGAASRPTGATLEEAFVQLVSGEAR